VKRIITLGVVLALVAPALLLAQTVDYYGFDNSTKTELVSWIETAIDNGSVSFDTQAHKDAYLGLINDLYAARNAADWDECIAVANSLAVASGNIVGNNSALAASICNAIKNAYSSNNYLVLKKEHATRLKNLIGTGNPEDVVLEIEATIHVEGMTIETKDSTTITIEACTTITLVLFPENKS